MKKRALLFGNGSYDKSFDYLKEVGYDPDQDYLIAVDGGLDFLDQLKINPDLIIGDLDSTTIDPKQNYPNTELIKHPARKNETDTELALSICKDKKIEEIVLIGMTGDRLDHSLANILLLEAIAREGITASLIDHKNYMTCIKGPIELETEFLVGQTVSLIPITKKVTHVTISGFEYKLEDYKLKRKHPGRAVSNIVKDPDQTIRFKKGILLINAVK